jgi:hypothetical protein
VIVRPDGLATGPQDPLDETPPRRRGGIRRTVSLDQRRGDPGQPQHLECRGRDLITDLDGSTRAVDDGHLWVQLDPGGTIAEIAGEVLRRPVDGLEVLAGGSVSRGLRQRADELVATQGRRGSVLHQLLDDLPMAALISTYGSSREQPDFTLPPEAAERFTDLCSGWRDGGTMLGTLERTGRFPIPIGPPAPALARQDDPLAWHDLPAMAPRSIRRVRRIDAAILDGVAHLDVHYRDSHRGLGDEPEDVLHEYVVALEVDPVDQVVQRASATARVLPWPECPGALASAERVAGERLDRLRPLVTMRFQGTTTCTHLNDTLRSVAGAANLLAALS